MYMISTSTAHIWKLGLCLAYPS